MEPRTVFLKINKTDNHQKEKREDTNKIRKRRNNNKYHRDTKKS